MYKKAHDAIRANPDREAKKEKTGEPKRWTAKKLNDQQRKHRVANKKAYYRYLAAQQGDE